MNELLQEAREAFDSLAVFRKKRTRCCDYTYGRQWNDMIEINGRRMSEYEYILSEGNVPLKNNLIRRIVRNVIGVFRQRLPEIMKTEYQGSLETIARGNGMEEIFCRSFEEFLISGMVVHRKRPEWPQNQQGDGIGGVVASEVSTEIVSPASFFFNTDSRDIRGRDLHLLGMIHEVTFDDWCRAFVRTPEDYKKAKAIFTQSGRRVKVTEVWKKEPTVRYIVHDRKAGYIRRVAPEDLPSYPSGMRRKWSLEDIWRFYFITDDGTVLLSGDSPYPHGSHPFVMKCYPFIDGEIHSFVGDMIDQQKYTNRLITLYDWVIRASAKGVLLVPEGSVDPENYQAMADQWSRFNGVIVYKPKIGMPEPKQVSGNMSNLGISELLEIQLKMMEDVSGVNGILQGNTTGGNVSGTLYNSQTANALYSLSDILETFGAFIHDSACLDSILAGDVVTPWRLT